jgi:plastocyanin
MAPLKDTLLLAPGESYDLLFVADQGGMFPFHDHFETANTNNGVWLGGMHTMVSTGALPGTPAGPPAQAIPDGPRVYIRDNFYTPNNITVSPGTTVVWEHQGRVDHTVSSLQGYFDSGALHGGDYFTYTFTVPGRYDYFCRFHITNRGVIIVQ